jgi:hypothetical protein
MSTNLAELDKLVMKYPVIGIGGTVNQKNREAFLTVILLSKKRIEQQRLGLFFYRQKRSLAVWLTEKGYYTVKDVNPSLAYDQCKSAFMMKKNDEHDAYCVATVLINQLHTLIDAKPENKHWTLSQLVNSRGYPCKRRYPAEKRFT